MKRAAAEEDIYHLFRIMLGRRPSPASYVQSNTGAPLGELIRRMAASDEFAEKVLNPLRAARKVADRPLREEEQRWLTSAAQLPDHYAHIVARAPTQFRAALTLALRAFEGAGGRSAERRQAITAALDPLGVKLKEERPTPEPPRKSRTNPSLSAQDWEMLWTLLGGENAPDWPGRRARLTDLAHAIGDRHFLSDRLVPALLGQKELPGWSAIDPEERRSWVARQGGSAAPFGELSRLDAAWIHLIAAGDQSLVGPLLAILRQNSTDCADAIDLLTRFGKTQAGILTARRDRRLAEALFAAERTVRLGETYAAPLLQQVRQDLARETDWSERLVLGALVARLIDEDADPASASPELVEVSLAEARKIPPQDRGASYLIRLSEHRLSDGVRALLGQAFSIQTIIAVRRAETCSEMPAELLSLHPDPVGIAVRSAADLPKAIAALEAQAIPGPISLPALASERQAARPLADDKPVVICAKAEALGALPAQTLAIAPDQTIAEALDALSGPDDLPVLISHADLPLSPAHLSIALAHYQRFGRPPVLSLAGIEVSLWSRELRFRPLTGDQAEIAPLVWLPMSVISLATARALKFSFAEAANQLFGAQSLTRDAGLSRDVAYAVSADQAMAARAEQVAKPLLAEWIRALRQQSPAIAANLPSLARLRGQALAGPAARRAVAARALDQADATLAAVERLASGRLEAEQLREIASPQTVDVLLADGQHVAFGEALTRLVTAQTPEVFAEEATLRWALRAASLAGMEPTLGAALLRSAPSIIATHPDLLRPIFETLASTAAPERMATVLIGVIEQADASKTARFRHRVAEICRLYLDGPATRAVMEACGDEPFTQSIQAAFSVALGRDGLDDGKCLPPSEALRLAISKRDTNGFIAATRAHADMPLQDYLDPLRAFAKELAEMDLPESALPYHRANDDTEMAIMAMIFGDRDRLETVAGSPELDREMAATLAACLGDRDGFLSFLRGLGAGPALADQEGASPRWIFDAYASAPAMPAAEGTGRVTVIMSSLETEAPLLEAAVASILNQSHRDLELLLIDDGSSQAGTQDLMRISQRDPRIRAYAMPRNLGPYLCRNFALSVATGCFVAIQDADDIAHPDRLALQVAAMHADPRRQLVTSHHIRIDPRGWPQLEHRFRLLGDGTMTSLFRREVFAELGPFLPVRSRGDVEMRERIRRWYGAEALHRIDFPLVACHASPQTLSQRTVAAKGNFLQLFRKGIDTLRLHPDHLGPEAGPKIAIPAPLQA